MTILVSFIDDSPTARNLLRNVLRSMPSVHILGEAEDAFQGWQMIKAAKPQVLILDVNLPGMNGIVFLRKLMAHFPLPVVLVSGSSTKASELTFQALEAGAVDFVAKPDAKSTTTERFSRRLAVAVQAAAQAVTMSNSTALALPTRLSGIADSSYILIGASTGGTKALPEVLRRLPANSPGVAIVQHMPRLFTKPFAERLNAICPMTVLEAKDGQRMTRGTILIAPGDQHMQLVGHHKSLTVRLNRQSEVNGHRPAVDVLFHSCAKLSGARFSAALMTGMGCDGAEGLLALQDAGAFTIAQNEQSCVVFGMPAAAISRGAASLVCALDTIPEKLLDGLRSLIKQPS